MKSRLMIAIFVALILRIIAMSQHDFWFDEALTYHIARLPLTDLLHAVLFDNNPPLYYLIIHFLLKITSDATWLRLPSLLFNLSSAIFLFVFLKKQINRVVALSATSFFIFSPLSIYLATEARLHSLAALLLILSVTTFFNYLKAPNLKNSLIFIFTTSLGFYSQYYLLLLLIPYLLIVLAKKLSREKLLILSLPFLTFVPWLIISLLTTHNGCWCPSTILSLPSTLVSPIISGVGVVTMRNYPSLDFTTLFIFSSGTIAFFYFFAKGLLKHLSLSLVYLIPLLIISIVGFVKPLFSPKAFSVFIPIYFAMVATGIDKKRINIITIGLALMLVIISLVQIQNQFFHGEKLQPIYQLTLNKPTLPIAHTSLLTYYSFAYYSYNTSQNLLISSLRETSPLISSLRETNFLITRNPLNADFVNLVGGQTQQLPGANTFWLVDTNKWADPETRQAVMSQLDTNYYFSQVQTQDNITLFKLKRK